MPPRAYRAPLAALALSLLIAAPAASAVLAQDQPAASAGTSGQSSGQSSGQKISKAHKPEVSDAWRQGTGITSGAIDSNPQCEPLKRTMQARIAAIGALRREIDQAKAAPPKTVVGTLQQWMGETYVSPVETRSEGKLAETRASAKELNDMLAAAHCERVDVEAEVAKARALEDLQAPASVTPPSLTKDNRSLFDDPAPR